MTSSRMFSEYRNLRLQHLILPDSDPATIQAGIAKHVTSLNSPAGPHPAFTGSNSRHTGHKASVAPCRMFPALVALVSFLLPWQVLAYGLPPWARRVLSFNRLSPGDQARTRFAASALASPGLVSCSINVSGRFVIASPDGVLTNDRFYATHFAGTVRTRISGSGDWLASCPKKFMYNGNLYDDPERSRLVFEGLSEERPGFKQDSMPALPEITQVEAAPPSKRRPRLPASASSTVVSVDRIPPFVRFAEVILEPDHETSQHVLPPRIVVGRPGAQLILLFSEKLKVPPQVRITQGDRVIEPGLLRNENPRFTYRFVPDPSPGLNGPATLSVQGVDLAGNELALTDQYRSYPAFFLVDTVPPSLRRTDTSQAGNLRCTPAEGAVLAENAFPKVIQAFIFDYEREDDGSLSPANLSVHNASGVDWNALRDGRLSIHLFSPSGTEIPGMAVARPPALELLLPDVYDPSRNVFPDLDGDGRADPTEGTYTVELRLVDRAGNARSVEYRWGLDTTPVAGKHVQVTVHPVLTSPFRNPENPIPGDETSVKRLDSVEISSTDPEFSYERSNATLSFHPHGANLPPKPVRTSLERRKDLLVLHVSKDQDGDGLDDFENPEPGVYLPQGTPDPRWGMNDGLYILRIDAVDTAGNHFETTRTLRLDTTSPILKDTFPRAETTVGPPLRMVDAIILDPAAANGSRASGIRLDQAFITLDFKGNAVTPPQRVHGVGFIHDPNDDDPTVPGYEASDRHPKLLFEILDDKNHVTSLPADGSWDGIYVLRIQAADQAGNPITTSVEFTYSSTATPASSTTLRIAF